MRVLVFGDSITRGHWDAEGGWVERVRKHYDLLQVADLDGRDDPAIINLGIGGDNSDRLQNRIQSEIIARTNHDIMPIVIIQIGINDSSTDDLPSDESVSLPIEKYEQNLRAIIEKIKPLSLKIIFVGLSACDESLTTPVSWGEYYYTNDAIKNYENKMMKIATEKNIPFIPVFESFFEELNKGKDYLSDGLHPNNEGHEFMGDIILKELDSLLV